MLFDLRGRRRRAVQATYLTLALLMGGGLVLFGIGGDVSGGLVDAFRGGGGGGGDSALEDRVERQEERLAANPDNPAVLQNLVRDYFTLATSQRESGSAGFPQEARDELRQAAGYWERYSEAAEGEPDAGTAAIALQIYDSSALDQPKQAQEAAAIMAREANDVASYLRLVSYAAIAGDTRTADLAAKKAVDLAPKDQQKQVRQQAEALRAQAQQQEPAG